MVAVKDDVITIALELAFVAVLDEESLPEYAQAVTKDLDRDELLELVCQLAGTAAGTWEAWAEEVGRPVGEMIQATGVFNATRCCDNPD